MYDGTLFITTMLNSKSFATLRVLLYYWCFSFVSGNRASGLLSVSLHYEPDVNNNVSSSMGNSCSISRSANGAVSLTVNEQYSCNVSIVSTDDGRQPLIMLNIIDANIQGTDYLYVQSGHDGDDDNDDQRTKYASFFGELRSHKIAFSERVLSLCVRTTSLMTIETNSHSGTDDVPIFNWKTEIENPHVQVYRRISHCSMVTWDFMIWGEPMTQVTCYAQCEPECNCSLLSRAFESVCPTDQGNPPIRSKTLLIIPPAFIALDLSNNDLRQIEVNSLGASFQGRKGVQWMYLNNNYLRVLKPGVFHGLHNLGMLDLSENELSHIESGVFVGLPNLNELYLDFNLLTTLEAGAFQGLRSVTTLHMCCNRITTLPKELFKELANLEWLSLADNRLQTLDYRSFLGAYPEGAMGLHELALQKNILKQIPKELFRLLPNLTLLDLAENRLKELPNFEQLPKLKTLDLRSNPLKMVRKETFRDLVLSTVILVDEPGTCCFVETSQCNATNVEPPYLTCERLLPNLTLRLFMWILGWSALLGNLFVLIWRCIGKMEEDKVQSTLITNLALSDMLTGIYMLILVFADIHFERYFPSYAEDWRMGPICKMAGVLSLTACEASVFFITLISLDRFIRVVYPHTLHRLTPQSTQTTAITLWGVSLSLGAIAIAFVGVNNDVYDISEVCIGLPLVRKSVYREEEVPYKKVEWFVPEQSISVRTQIGSTTGMYFSIAVFLGLNLFCFMIVMFCYMAILKAVRDTSKRVKLARHRDREIKMAAKMFLLVATDFLCWVPIILTGILVQSGAVEISPEMFAWAVTFILPINSSVNPYLYTITTLLTKRLGCRQSAITGSTGLSEKSERPSRSANFKENGSARMELLGESGKENGVTMEVATKV